MHGEHHHPRPIRDIVKRSPQDLRVQQVRRMTPELVAVVAKDENYNEFADAVLIQVAALPKRGEVWEFRKGESFPYGKKA